MESYEDLSPYKLAQADVERLLHTQTECTFAWAGADGWPTAVTMRFLWRDDRFWMTATHRRSRVAALQSDPRSSVVVSSAGTDLSVMWSVTAIGRCTVLDRREIPGWFYAAWADNHPHVGEDAARYIQLLDSPGRVVLMVQPERWTTFDGERMIAATGGAMRPEGAD